jgi:hypothetical protein
MGLRASHFWRLTLPVQTLAGVRSRAASRGGDGTAEGPYPAPTFLTSFTSANLTSGARSAV